MKQYIFEECRQNTMKIHLERQESFQSAMNVGTFSLIFFLFVFRNGDPKTARVLSNILATVARPTVAVRRTLSSGVGSRRKILQRNVCLTVIITRQRRPDHDRCSE